MSVTKMVVGGEFQGNDALKMVCAIFSEITGYWPSVAVDNAVHDVIIEGASPQIIVDEPLANDDVDHPGGYAYTEENVWENVWGLGDKIRMVPQKKQTVKLVTATSGTELVLEVWGARDGMKYAGDPGVKPGFRITADFGGPSEDRAGWVSHILFYEPDDYEISGVERLEDAGVRLGDLEVTYYRDGKVHTDVYNASLTTTDEMKRYGATDRFKDCVVG